MKRVRLQTGSVVFDKRIRSWNFLWREDGHRRSKAIGSIRDYPTKASAWKAARLLRLKVESPVQQDSMKVPTVNALVSNYRVEKMPKRTSTRYGYDAWLRNHVVPRWGECELNDLQARPVIVAAHAEAVTEEPSAHSGAVARSVGLRDVARRHANTAQPDGACDYQGRN